MLHYKCGVSVMFAAKALAYLSLTSPEFVRYGHRNGTTLVVVLTEFTPRSVYAEIYSGALFFSLCIIFLSRVLTAVTAPFDRP